MEQFPDTTNYKITQAVDTRMLLHRKTEVQYSAVITPVVR